MIVKEIMTTDVKSIPPDAKVKDAWRVLEQLRISGLPVIDRNQRLVGMFTEKEILSYILPSYIDQVGKFVYKDDPKSIKKKFEKLAELTVGELVRQEVVTVDENSAVCEVARLMLIQKARRIPVLDKERKVVGIIAREDVVRAYTREIGWETD